MPSRSSRSNQLRAPRKGLVAARATEKERQRDVLLGGQLGHELAELEDEAEAITPQPGALRLPHRVEALAVEVDLTGVRDEDARQAVEQGRLARAARAHHGDDLAALHREAGPAKRRGLAEGEREVPRLDDRASGLDRGGTVRRRSRRHLLGERREPRCGEVDPAQIGLQVEEAVVGEEGVDEVAPLLELGELAHPPEVRGPLGVEVLLRRGDRA